jgi:hypothetical protein
MFDRLDINALITEMDSEPGKGTPFGQEGASQGGMQEAAGLDRHDGCGDVFIAGNEKKARFLDEDDNRTKSRAGR